ncbi:hypothetical protein AV530_008020 [Patagioenas fasciata monilis]|uniref:Uncharacterized protein n=1 Tax=Patagioenas fasciata monilis TaxID=372326 RepID=A0A1V4KU40_PATFA|nr:hypothetical protein AV530_008020 [Patagioenas fasciata monilis]
MPFPQQEWALIPFPQEAADWTAGLNRLFAAMRCQRRAFLSGKRTSSSTTAQNNPLPSSRSTRCTPGRQNTRVRHR